MSRRRTLRINECSLRQPSGLFSPLQGGLILLSASGASEIYVDVKLTCSGSARHLVMVVVVVVHDGWRKVGDVSGRRRRGGQVELFELLVADARVLLGHLGGGSDAGGFDL